MHQALKPSVACDAALAWVEEPGLGSGFCAVPGHAVQVLAAQPKGLDGIVRFSVVALGFWPVSAWAIVGTPLVLGTALHLVFGNLLIGLLEGWLLARVFRVSSRRCSGWWSVAANHVSACSGLALPPHLSERYAIDIHTGLRVTWLRVAAGYVLTLIMEWPFVAACFRATAG
jgi:hypothetical protein